jgi:hypothetical protein
MKRGSLLGGALALFLVFTAACTPNVDLTKALTVTDVLSGYYDEGVKNGVARLPPSITFRLHNSADKAIGPVQITVAFWQDGVDGEWNSAVVQGIGSEGLKPGASTEPLVVRNPNAYTPEGGRQVLFTHSLYKDVTAKIFASQAGNIVKLGEYKVDRTILPRAR